MLSNIYSMYKVENMEYIINNNFQQPNKRGETMKKKIYGDTEIFSESACENCKHLIEDDNGKLYCNIYPEDGEYSEENAPSLVFSIYHGTYGNVNSSGCDCDDFEPLYDGE